jgi:release factor glutamine methyltransferase
VTEVSTKRGLVSGSNAGGAIRARLDDACRRMAAVGIEAPRLDARLLLALALKAPEDRFYGREDDLLDADASATFDQLVSRRCQREPVSRIVGRRGFWTLDLELNEASLDPRPDSETLIEAVLEHVTPRQAPLRALDLGTGTGCLLLSILAEYPNATGLGVDLSLACVALAGRNARRNRLESRAEFQNGDWMGDIHTIFDVIICNPPYIPAGQISTLAPEVAVHEPRLALDGGVDGLDCYRQLAVGFADVLAEHGLIFLEIGHDQQASVSKVMQQAGWRTVATRSDLAGHDRCLVLQIGNTGA